MPGETSITIPGTQVKVPRWGLIAGVGGLAAVFLFLRNKGAATTEGDASAGQAAADQGAANADLLSYLQDLFANLQGMGGPGEDIAVPTPVKQTQPRFDNNPAPTSDFSQPTMQITPSSYVAAVQTPQYVAAGVGAGGSTPKAGTSGYTGGHPSFVSSTPAPSTNTSGYTGGHPSFSQPTTPIVQKPISGGVQQ